MTGGLRQRWMVGADQDLALLQQRPWVLLQVGFEVVWVLMQRTGWGTGGAAPPVLSCWSASEIMWAFCCYSFTDLLSNSSLRSACLEASYSCACWYPQCIKEVALLAEG